MSGLKNCGTYTQWNTTQKKERSPTFYNTAERTPTFCDSMDGTGDYYA